MIANLVEVQSQPLILYTSPVLPNSLWKEPCEDVENRQFHFFRVLLRKDVFIVCRRLRGRFKEGLCESRQLVLRTVLAHANVCSLRLFVLFLY